MRQPSVMSAQQHFSKVPSAEISRSKFDRSHGVKTTLDAGYLVPFYVDEVLPGDSFHMSTTMFGRLSTPLRPVMDNIYLESFFFFIPYRLVWDNWVKLCGERKNPADTINFTVPQIPAVLTLLNHDDLYHYLGLPLGVTGSVSVSALPGRAYMLVWSEWFRDQNLQNYAGLSHGDGPDPWYGNFKCLRRGKRHDYFTSCLPWPQKGDPAVIPVGGIDMVAAAPPRQIMVMGPGGVNVGGLQITSTGAITKSGTNPGSTTAAYWSDPAAETTMANAVGATINDLRAAFQIQRLLERDARSGTRYIEIVKGQFNVESDDLRAMRPEYLGGGSERIAISPVPSTFSSVDTPQGDLAGIGTVVQRGGFSKSFTEHGILLGLANVRADLTYQQGIEKMFMRRTRFDFYWPALAHLGEQAVLNSEIFFTGVPATDNSVFGYQERYAEYRYKPSKIQGRFHSADPQSLDMWHLAQDFAALPVLNASFIEDNPPIDRVVAVATEPHLLLDVWLDLKCDRPMPVYSVPGMSDHF